MDGWVKEKFDVAMSDTPGASGVGVFLQDSAGCILLKGAKKLLIGTNNIAECQAAL